MSCHHMTVHEGMAGDKVPPILAILLIVTRQKLQVPFIFQNLNYAQIRGKGSQVLLSLIKYIVVALVLFSNRDVLAFSCFLFE